MLQMPLDTVFHALMSKIRYALCAWGGFLTHTHTGMTNAFLHHFVSECFDIDAIMVDMNRKFIKCCFPQPTPLSAFFTRSCQKQSTWAPFQGLTFQLPCSLQLQF